MNYTHLLPFMEKEELKKIAFQVLDGELKGVKIEKFFPFLDKSTLNDIVDKLIDTKNGKVLNRTLPFISKDKVEDIYQRAEKGELPGVKAQMCIPFLGSEKIKEIFNDLIRKASQEDDDTDIEFES